MAASILPFTLPTPLVEPSAATFTIYASTSYALDGASSLAFNPSGAGTMQARTGFYAVVGGAFYSALASALAGVTAADFTIGIKWYDGTTLLSTSTSASILDAVGTWTQNTLYAQAPSSANQAAVEFTTSAAAAGDRQYLDCVGLFPGQVTTWSRGGLNGLGSVVITRSDGLYVRNASPANPLPLPATTQQVTLNDYEVVPGTSYTYTGVVVVVLGPNATITSAPSAATAPVSLTTTQWWEIDPTNPSSAINANPTDWSPVNTEQSTAHMVTGTQVLLMVADTMLHQDFSGTFEIFANSVYAQFQALLKSQKTVFIQSPWGDTDSGYFRVGPQSGGLSTGMGNKAKDTKLLASTTTANHRTVAITAIAQMRPNV